MNEHRMTLDAEYFEKIENGTKTVELRLYDEKRRQIRLGDIILFNRKGERDVLRTRVVGLCTAPSFAVLLSDGALLARALPCADSLEAQQLLRRFYTEADEARWGVVGIEIKLE
ncbi:MAG: ASCH domain-containing protein [Clostridia bacterium]|nr:ASCH domain-containing protein [Clostridia bacterium]